MKLTPLELAYITKLVGQQSYKWAQNILKLSISESEDIDVDLLDIEEKIIIDNKHEIDNFNNDALYGKLCKELEELPSAKFRYQILYIINGKYSASEFKYESVDKFVSDIGFKSLRKVDCSLIIESKEQFYEN